MNIPRPEYPRPQLSRGTESWLNLNGKWEFEFDFGKSGHQRDLLNKPYSKEITVPFVPESALSGIEYLDFIPCCWYRKKFTLPDKFDKNSKRIILHFGAVDWECTTYVNGNELGNHKGGYTPFSYDITDFVIKGENTIVLRVIDDTGSPLQPSGKQSNAYFAYGCLYPRCTGIWQTVWLEFVPKTYIKNLKMTPDIDRECVDIQVDLAGDCDLGEITALVSFKGASVSSAKCKVNGNRAFMSIPVPSPQLWDIGQPNLYDIIFTAGEDAVVSYFGMRKISVEKNLIKLNNRTIFMRFILDQGYYPDGIYTAPDDEALRHDIELSMKAGFNGARMHMKTFEPRFIYHADHMGYLLHGEYGNWGLDISRPESILSMLPDWLEEIKRDYNSPAIITWCPFNETDLSRIPEIQETFYKVTKMYDSTRPVIDVSGYVHTKETDIYDVHIYEQDPVKLKEVLDTINTGNDSAYVNNRDREKYCGQPYFVSEYGGTLWTGEEQKQTGWGYGNAPKTLDELYERLEKLTSVILDNPKIAGFCYTQLTDVFQEQNGLYYFDRRAKFDTVKLHAIFSRKAAIEGN